MPPSKHHLHVTNRLHPGAIGDAIAAIPTVWALAKSGLLNKISFTSKPVVGLFDLGIEQVHGTGTGASLQLETQALVQHGTPADSMLNIYAKAAGIRLSKPFWPQIQIPLEPLIPPAGPFILLAPHSNSDMGTGTKLWALDHWLDLIAMFQLAGIRSYMLCGAGEQTADRILEEAVDLTLAGLSLPLVATWMRQASAVITVDNGMGWLAQATQVPHVLLLASNLPPTRSANLNPQARNISNCHTAEPLQVWQAFQALRTS